MDITGWTEVDRESALLATVPKFVVLTVFNIDPANYETHYYVEETNDN